VKAEVTNQELENILTKTMSMNKKYCSKKLTEIVWAYNNTWKITIGITPFELVYGNKSMLPIEFEYHTLRSVAELDMNFHLAQKQRLIKMCSIKMIGFQKCLEGLRL
jgi:hypothetical protein